MAAIAENQDALINNPADFSVGPADAPVTVVEFFDYRCGFCKRSAEWATQLPEGLSVAYCSETFPQIGASAIQVFGGAGFTWEYDVQLFYKRLLSLQMTWGGSEKWLEELAKLVIDKPAPAIVPG